jgi:hypothetical protein
MGWKCSTDGGGGDHGNVKVDLGLQLCELIKKCCFVMRVLNH